MRARLVGAVAAVLLAAAGTLVLVTYVKGAEARALAGTRTVNVLVVSEAVPEGTPAGDLVGLVASEAVPAKVVAAGSVASLDQLRGKVATVDLEPGEQLLSSRFTDPAELEAQGRIEIPDGMQQVSVSLDAQRALGGNLSAGDTVGVFVSLSNGDEQGEATTHLVLHKVLVTQVQGGATPEPGAEDGAQDSVRSAPAPQGGLLVTFATTAAEAEKIVFAAEHGTMWLSNEPADASEDGTRIQTKEEIYR